MNLLGSGKQLVKVEVSFFLPRWPEVEVVLSQVPQVQFKPLQVKHPLLPLRHQVINSLIPLNFYYVVYVSWTNCGQAPFGVSVELVDIFEQLLLA